MESIFSERKTFIPIASIVVLSLSGLAYHAAKTGSDVFLGRDEAVSSSAGSVTSDAMPSDRETEIRTDTSADSVLAENSVPETPQKTSEANVAGESSYPTHAKITATIFWVGESAGPDNRNISNVMSAWDGRWMEHFGGVDDPAKRSGYFPAAFRPKENPFYFALPYNDFRADGSRKKDALSVVPWAKRDGLKKGESIVKNRWIKITKNGTSAYAQWEDVGPFGWNDAGYVFGGAKPKNKENDSAGLDVSPAVGDFLGLKGMEKVDWQFVEADQVPNGPWKDIVTTSQIDWK